MNKESKSYTLLYTMALVMIVGSALAYTAITLKDRQQANIDADKMRQILASVRITPAADSIVESYRHYITDSYVVDASGNRLEGDNAFDVNVGAQMRLPGGERELPVYVCTLADGSENISCRSTAVAFGGRYGDMCRSIPTRLLSTTPILPTRARLPVWERKSRSRRSAASSWENGYSSTTDSCQ